MAFLDSSSNGNRYSSRAANAAICASDISIEDFVAYHNYLFRKDVQPAENSNGRTDTQLIGYAQKAKIPQAKVTSPFTPCVTDETHKAMVLALTEQASRKGVNSTPTIKVNGKSISPTVAAWNKAIAAALVKGPAPNPSKTPTTTPSPSPSGSGSSSASTPPAKSSTTPKPAGSSSG